MRTLINWRNWALAALILVSFVCLLSEPADNGAWLSVLLVSRGIGILALCFWAYLVRSWSKSGKLPWLSDMINNVE